MVFKKDLIKLIVDDQFEFRHFILYIYLLKTESLDNAILAF